ncbi:hypothetical protein [Streptomyces sp. MST-110588]|uniref:hypothetical protein n=1 Tax=Streptomyces sp. MST-110588 TaxID=2833628 RepID=UPI001F5CE76B|nr:hypothetical protein [Streptomyces sp. MST-110588]UNO39174.1 hypothetical protein KGS77_05435 [Streptomyces sp. MST-110588]
MGRDSSLRIGLAVMHHPSRKERIPGLVERCAPLAVDVVCDPRPTGPPSPLRTAKRAWAAVDARSTHHVVLQDDVLPCPQFAALLHEAVTSRPDCAIALYVNWNSPRNSYLARRAIVAGGSWVRLSSREYTPTLGLVLPARHAEELAAFLAGFPDSFVDDDELVTRFCRERGIEVWAPLPTLLEHGGDQSLAGNDSHGARNSVLFAGTCEPVPGQWRTDIPANRHAPPPHRRFPVDFSVELAPAGCLIRFERPETGEAIDHLFGWYWQDWLELLGIAPSEITEAWQHATLPPHTKRTEQGEQAQHTNHAAYATYREFAFETWAAGFLLGADAAHLFDPPYGEVPPHPAAPAMLRACLDTWVRSGLPPRGPGTPGADGVRHLTDIAVAAVHQGISYARNRTPYRAEYAERPQPRQESYV